MNMEIELRKLEKIVPGLKTKEEVEMVIAFAYDCFFLLLTASVR